MKEEKVSGEEVQDEESVRETEESAQETEENVSPKKKSKIKNIFYDIILVGGIGLLIWGGGSAIRKYLREEKDKALYQELNQEFVQKSTEKTETKISWGGGNGDSDSADTIWYRKASVNFDGLNAMNEDVVGWLFFENESISYPILYSGDDDYYLHRTLDRVDSESGSIFLEGENNPDFTDKANIVYGHNMKNSSMFGKLRQYKEDDDYYKNHQYFQILTEGGKAYRYQVFSYFDIDQHEVEMVDVGFYDSEDPSTFVTEMRPKDNTKAIEKILKIINNPKKKMGAKELRKLVKEKDKLSAETESVVVNQDNTYENYLQTLKSRSLRDTGIEPGSDSRVVGLFTCSSNRGNRLIVYGVCVAEHDFGEIVEENKDIQTLDR